MITKLYVQTQLKSEELIKDFLNKEDGVTAIEYAVVAAGVTAIVAVLFGSTGPVKTMLTSVITAMSAKITALLK
ncbi:Flp family type IVb pilin [Vibrio mediterranei]|uniref:Flp family type IVb pilin n=1 Tax=Vibrio mediterranei TaxID=689 RepID=UPI00148C61A4|nr:Flp family type IVb pilin [Vibrio mediterranei]NOI26769.1 Flp family type IVb pilin [Vibrio mediterranei]